MILFIGYFEPSSLNLIVVLHRADALRTSKREMAVATRGRISVHFQRINYVIILSDYDLPISASGVEREIASLQLEERKLVAEIKKTAQTGNEVFSFVFKDVSTCGEKLALGFFAGNVCKHFDIHGNERCKQGNGCYEQGLVEVYC
ncbi:hypothetical protein GW17_00053243 [Ensete ventricosum]|nr:hypothetical protein GW17_00053243 [Ensete ventricosum]RZS22690.1 hypothetical protein BHM03_00055504 [Ensete ventricosum]